MKKAFPAKLKAGTRYVMVVTIKGDTVTTFIDGKEVASASSEGFSHPTKKMLRLSVPKSAAVDDLKIWVAAK